MKKAPYGAATSRALEQYHLADETNAPQRKSDADETNAPQRTDSKIDGDGQM